MKVGTDGTLLGAWCEVSPDDKLSLDIGAGTGLIALMLTQRTSAPHRTCAVECDPASFLQAVENISISPWPERISAYLDNIQDFATRPHLKHAFDHIVSNPPYFSSSMQPPDKRRTIARHTDSLNFDELMDCCRRLLKPKGRISLIIPESEVPHMMSAAGKYGFGTVRHTCVTTSLSKNTKRRLLEFRRAALAPDTEPQCETLCIETAPKVFSDEYKQLMKDFYLKF